MKDGYKVATSGGVIKAGYKAISKKTKGKGGAISKGAKAFANSNFDLSMPNFNAKSKSKNSFGF